MSAAPHTVATLLAHATAYLQEHGFDTVSATQEARWLIAHALRTDGASLLTHSQKQLSPEEVEAVFTFLNQRAVDKKPLGYIIGNAPFCDLLITVKPPVLIPRMETEEWVTWLIEQLQNASSQNLSILDLCTGSGCIALALAHHVPTAQVTGADITAEALTLATHNAEQLGCKNVSFITSDLYTACNTKTFDMIVSNPPYLTDEEWHKIDASVQQWESPTALVAHDEGLTFYKNIISQAAAHLSGTLPAPLPELVLEIGHTQKKVVTTLLRDHHFNTLMCFQDAFGKDRWIAARR